MQNAWPLEVADTRLLLLPDRAAYWHDEKTLLVADVHVGKDATFREEAVPVPLGSTNSDLKRLSQLVEATQADRLVILGDLYHAAAGMTPRTLQMLRDWRSRHQTLDVVLVRGNHDRNAGRSPVDVRIKETETPLAGDPFVFCHKPEPAGSGYVIAGHVHPAVRVRGPAGQSERLRCFHATPSHLVLPAFSEFAGSHLVSPAENDCVVGIADDAVVPLSDELV